MAHGKLITIEGLDGAGKSTLAQALLSALGERVAHVELLREPGGVEVSERIRALVKDPALELAPRAEALLYAAARAQLCEQRLAPLLAEGALVLLDRFVDSSLAYQGAGRGLGVEAVRAINAFATGPIAPERTLLLRIDPAAPKRHLASEPRRLTPTKDFCSMAFRPSSRVFAFITTPVRLARQCPTTFWNGDCAC